jgi:hypothetical protein
VRALFVGSSGACMHYFRHGVVKGCCCTCTSCPLAVKTPSDAPMWWRFICTRNFFLGLRHAHPVSWHDDQLCVRKSVFLSWGAALVSIRWLSPRTAPRISWRAHGSTQARPRRPSQTSRYVSTRGQDLDKLGPAETCIPFLSLGMS